MSERQSNQVLEGSVVVCWAEAGEGREGRPAGRASGVLAVLGFLTWTLGTRVRSLCAEKSRCILMTWARFIDTRYTFTKEELNLPL